MRDTTGLPLTIASLAIAFAATMIAMWSLSHDRLVWGGYNFAITVVALVVMMLARARYRDA